ncbi:MAG: hypothetical protein NT150_01850 [Bacteroidetes bacterium]|nr:hypothetical protein [Bacteroidota bacterium]
MSFRLTDNWVINIKNTSIFFIAVFYFLGFGCANNLGTSNGGVVEETCEFTYLPDKAISISEYLEWIKEQKGITFSEKENQKSKISITYKPLALEAALSNVTAENSEAGYKNYIKAKEGYHYILVESLNKIPSASNLNAGKKELAAYVKNNLLVIENGVDTLTNYIVEEFPSSIMNKPDQLLLLVSKHSTEKIQVVIKSKSIGLEDVKITLTKKQIESFPQIKL